MIRPKILTNIAGSCLVVWFSSEHYIDVRKDVRSDRVEIAEIVRCGHVRKYVALLPAKAPETIIELIREETA